MFFPIALIILPVYRPNGRSSRVTRSCRIWWMSGSAGAVERGDVDHVRGCRLHAQNDGAEILGVAGESSLPTTFMPLCSAFFSAEVTTSLVNRLSWTAKKIDFGGFGSLARMSK